jgi:hypothetical protein
MTNHSLASQLKQIGLRALPTQLDDFLARVTKARCSAHPILEQIAKAEATERSRRSLERRLRISGIKRFKPMADFDWSWPAELATARGEPQSGAHGGLSPRYRDEMNGYLLDTNVISEVSWRDENRWDFMMKSDGTRRCQKAIRRTAGCSKPSPSIPAWINTSLHPRGACFWPATDLRMARICRMRGFHRVLMWNFMVTYGCCRDIGCISRASRTAPWNGFVRLPMVIPVPLWQQPA